jgi:hypothetical protein
VSVVGSTSAAGHRAVALVGRDVGCAVQNWCNTDLWPRGSKPATPISVRVSFVVPWTRNISVTVSRELFRPGATSSGPQSAPVSGMSVRMTSSRTALVTFTIPSMADGSAYNVVITGR